MPPHPSGPSAVAGTGASSNADGLLSRAETSLRFVAEGVSGSGVPGLEGPARTVLGIVSHIKRARDNSSACANVIKQIETLATLLRRAKERIDPEVNGAHASAAIVDAAVTEAHLGSSAELKDRIDRLQQRLLGALSDAERLQKQSRVRRLLVANRNAEVLKELSDNLRHAREDFTVAEQIATGIVVREISAAQIRASVDAQKAEERRDEAETARATETAQRDRERELKSALENLPHVNNAGYRGSVHARHGRLLAGTRKEILADIQSWISSAGGPEERQDCPFFILSGGAGTGKSTIAYEVARRADKAGHLGASFFFTRGAGHLSTTDLFFPTLAHQLITNVPILRDAALPVLERHLKHGPLQNMDAQASDLFVGLLSLLPSTHHPIVLIVDAVDECSDSVQDMVCRMLFLMLDGMSNIACPVRVFVTSRPEVHIQDAFQSTKFVSGAKQFDLHNEVSKEIINADIQSYLQHALSEFNEASRSALYMHYPDSLKDLTELASGLFIYASTAIEFLKFYRRAEIIRGMEQLLAIRADSKRANLSRLDQLYTIVLATSFPQKYLEDRRSGIRAILGCIAVLQDQISPDALALLTGTRPERDLLPVLERLQAVLSFDPHDSSAAIRPLHASFGEFLVDPARCTNTDFFVDPAAHHCFFTSHCLSLLQRPGVLARNVCQLADPSVCRNDIPDLSARVARHLPESVRYACTYWAVHVVLGRLAHEEARILDQLASFCKTRILEWLEGIAFLDHLDQAIHWLPDARELLLSATGRSEELAALLYDAFRIALDFSPAVKACPEQIYISALPQVPSSSILRALYAQVLSQPHAIRFRTTSSETWLRWLETQPSGQDGRAIAGIQRVRYAPHGRWVVAFGGRDGAIHTCHPITGDVIQSTYSHQSQVVHLHFSANGQRMVSTSESAVVIHNTRSGAVLHTLDPHIGVVTCYRAAFFVLNDEAVIVRLYTGDYENSIGIWNLSDDSFTPVSTTDDLQEGQMQLYDVSGNGRWAVVLKEVGIEGTPTILLDLSHSLTTSSYLEPSHAACFLPEVDELIMVRRGRLVQCGIPSGKVLHDFGIDLVDRYVHKIVVSHQTVVALTGPDESTPDTIELWVSDRPRVNMLVDGVEDIELSPDGKRIIVLGIGDSWWTVDATDLRAGTTATVLQADTSLHSHAVGVSADLSTIAISVAQGVSIYDSSLRHVLAHPLSSATTEEVEESDTWSPWRLAVNHDGTLVAAVLPRRIVLFVAGSEDQRILNTSRLEVALRAQHSYNGSNWQVSANSASFTPDGTKLVALCNVVLYDHVNPNLEVLYMVAWELRDSEESIWHFQVLGVDDQTVHSGRVVRSHCTAPSGESQLHFAIQKDWLKSEQTGALVTYTITLPGSNVQTLYGTLSAAQTTNLPDERYWLALDGWIIETSTNRRLCWIPSSRRPSPARSHPAVDGRAHLTAILADSGQLTVVDLFDYEYSLKPAPR